MKNKKTDQEAMEDISASNSFNFFLIYYPNIWRIFVLRDSGPKKPSIIFGEDRQKVFVRGRYHDLKKFPRIYRVN